MANALVGSAELLCMAGLFGLPMGVFAGIYLSEYGHNRFGAVVRYTTDILNGVPLHRRRNLRLHPVRPAHAEVHGPGGGAALGAMMIPIAVRTTEEFMNLVPISVREAAYALGIPRWKTVVFIVIPTAMRGIVTGIMLDFARWPARRPPPVHRFRQSLLEPGDLGTDVLPARHDLHLRHFSLRGWHRQPGRRAWFY